MHALVTVFQSTPINAGIMLSAHSLRAYGQKDPRRSRHTEWLTNCAVVGIGAKRYMVTGMVCMAQPSYFQWFGVIVVMSMRYRIAAYFAWLSL